MKQRKRLGKLFTTANERQKGNDLETLCRGMIRNLMFKNPTRADIIGELVSSTEEVMMVRWQSVMKTVA